MNRVLRILLLVVFILVPVVNFGLPPLSDAGNRFADDAQTRVNAAGYAFAIWGVIFTGMLLFSFYLLRKTEPESRHLHVAMICLAIAGVASILFVPISIYSSALVGWIDILLHLVPLVIAHFQLRKHAMLHPQNNVGRWTWYGPSMYFGWISAATVISTALMADEVGLVVSEGTATMVAIAVALLLAVWAGWLTLKRDPIYGATIAWALVAIGVEQAAFPTIRGVAWLAAGALTALVVYQFARKPVFYPIAER